MAEFTDLTLTNNGYELQIKAQTGTELKFTRVALGAGVLPSGTQLNALTALIDEKQTAAIGNLSAGGKSVQIKTNFSNKELAENYYLRELGVFANDPDQGEILYAIANAGDGADYMPAYDGAETIEQVFTIDLSVGNAANVTATFAESVYVLKAGDTMTGPLVLSGDPTLDLGAATKQYIDNLIKEAVNKADPLGVCKEFYDTDLPERHLWANGGTIGDASSGATALASAETADLYAVLWKTANHTGSQIQLYDSWGIAITKGESPELDLIAHKRLSLPDKRGRIGVGLDNMGGTSANVVTNTNADILCGVSGEESHTLLVSELPSHFHNAPTTNGISGAYEVPSGAYGYDYGNQSAPTTSTGGGTTHNNMQPWLACHYIMRY
jgi:hypothetical protein